MSYNYSFSYTNGLEEALAVNGISAAFSGVLNLAVFIFTALSLHMLAKNRGIRHGWLAWLPVVNVWVLGSLSDQYRYVARGEIKSKRKALLALSVIRTVLGWMFAIGLVLCLGHIAFGFFENVAQNVLMSRIAGPLMLVIGISLPMVGIAIAQTVLSFMALYDVYTSCDPRNSVMYLVLSIVFGFTKPFFLFFNRNKDDGMPPRRRPEPVYESPAWESDPEPQPQWEQPEE